MFHSSTVRERHHLIILSSQASFFKMVIGMPNKVWALVGPWLPEYLVTHHSRGVNLDFHWGVNNLGRMGCVFPSCCAYFEVSRPH